MLARVRINADKGTYLGNSPQMMVMVVQERNLWAPCYNWTEAAHTRTTAVRVYHPKQHFLHKRRDRQDMQGVAPALPQMDGHDVRANHQQRRGDCRGIVPAGSQQLNKPVEKCLHCMKSTTDPTRCGHASRNGRSQSSLPGGARVWKGHEHLKPDQLDVVPHLGRLPLKESSATRLPALASR